MSQLHFGRLHENISPTNCQLMLAKGYRAFLQLVDQYLHIFIRAFSLLKVLEGPIFGTGSESLASDKFVSATNFVFQCTFCC